MDTERKEGGGARQRDSALPCHDRNNSDKEPGSSAPSQHAKTAFALTLNVEAMCARHGVEKVGFLTLTTPTSVSPHEISRRFNSLARRFLKAFCVDYICVLERSPSGRVHLHLLVGLAHDIRTGFDFAAAARGDYRSACPALRSCWRQLRETLPGYGFGRHELMPIKGATKALARYVGKYISKHLDQRRVDDKGVRLVRYSSGARAASGRFSWNTAGARLWRRALAACALDLGFSSGRDFTEAFGRSWSFHLRNAIIDGPQTLRPTPRRSRYWRPREHEALPERKSAVQRQREAFKAAVCASGDRQRRRQWRRLFSIIDAVKAKRERDAAWERSLQET